MKRKKISEIKSGGPADIGAQAAGEALRTLAQEQEQISRRLIDFYIGMISDLKKDSAEKDSRRQQFLGFVRDCLATAGPGIGLPDFEEIRKTINA